MLKRNISMLNTIKNTYFFAVVLANSERLDVLGERSAIHAERSVSSLCGLNRTRLLLNTPLVTVPFKPKLIHAPKITAHPSRHVSNIHLPNENNKHCALTHRPVWRGASYTAAVKSILECLRGCQSQRALYSKPR